MELEKGAKFYESSDMPSLPPEIENEFLNYIEQFEKISENEFKQTTLFETCVDPLTTLSSNTFTF